MKLKVIGSSSKGNAYALISNDGILLMECGMLLREVKKAIDYQILKVKGCLLSHGHSDHSKYIREYLSAGIPVYTNDETQEDIDIITGERLIGVPEKKSFMVGKFSVVPFYVEHDDTPNFAYIIEHEEMGRLLFATDYEYISWTFRSWGINHFLIECNYDMNFVDQSNSNYDHVLRGHASLQTCMGVINANKTPHLQNVILCHLSGSSGSADYFVNEVQKVAGKGIKVCYAESGLNLELFKDPF